MIFKNDGEDVKTVSKFLIVVLALVNIAKIKAHYDSMISRFFTRIFLLLTLMNPFP